MTKAEPLGRPSRPSDLIEKVGPAGRAPRDPGDLRIQLEVSGGQPMERYEFYFAASGAGEVEIGFLDRLRDVSVSRRVETLPRADFSNLLRRLDVAKLLDANRRIRPIPPDSLVGELTVWDGNQSATLLFMADEGQAETAGARLPDDIRAVVDAIYDLAAQHLGQKSVRPLQGGSDAVAE